MRNWLWCAVLIGFTGCADTKTLPDLGPDFGVGDLETERAVWPDQAAVEAYLRPDGFVLGKTVVYAQTESELYKVDPETLEITLIGAFSFPAGTTKPRMTDIALDKDGRMIGVTSEGVYEVDPATAVCTYLAAAPGHYVGLSFVHDPSSIEQNEYLMGMAKGGEIYEINPKTGEARQRGSLGNDPIDTVNPLIAAGDIVSIRNFKTLATVLRPGYDNDWLAELDPKTGEAILIGDTGVKKIWGLGFWKRDGENRVFGFTTEGKFVLIDVRTGKATLQSEDVSHVWWGAGVTTEAPAIL